MRISDWSSDVCSSDLPEHAAIIVDVGLGLGPHQHARAQDDIAAELAVERIAHVTRIAIVRRRVAQEEGQHRRAGELLKLDQLDTIVMRSEEHKSELQSLMRISYAVFCLKKNRT